MVAFCTGNTPISLGFLLRPDEAEWMSFGFDTAVPVGTGQTGRFAVQEIQWDYGTGGEVSVPSRFTGPGTLAVAIHQTTIGNARLTGTVTGQVRDEQEEAVDLLAEFDVANFSCWTR